MVVNPTLGIGATGPGAGVDTLVSETGSVRGTVGVDDTLRSAGYVRVSEVLRDTLTGRSVSLFAADCVGPTGRGVTGVDIFHPWWHWQYRILSLGIFKSFKSYRLLFVCNRR